jgi:hypothetical protein
VAFKRDRPNLLQPHHDFSLERHVAEVYHAAPGACRRLDPKRPCFCSGRLQAGDLPSRIPVGSRVYLCVTSTGMISCIANLSRPCGGAGEEQPCNRSGARRQSTGHHPAQRRFPIPAFRREMPPSRSRSAHF